MKRDAEGQFGPAGKRAGKAAGEQKGVPRTRTAFKVLVTDNLAASILGARGAVKDEIQQETGTKIVFSNRGDYFPHTYFRVMAIYSDDPNNIMRAFEWILPRIVDAGEEERKNPPKEGPELLGKEPGEYVFRFCVTKKMSSHIIGSGGVNIKQIRTETGAKVFIENDTQLGHRLCRVIGQPDQILPSLEMVSEYVNREAEDQDSFYSSFANIVNFGQAEAEGWTPPSEQQDFGDDKGKGGKGKGGKGGSWGGSGGHKGGGGGKWQDDNSWGGGGNAHVVVPPSKPKQPTGPPPTDWEVGDEAEPRECDPPLGTVQEEVDGLADVLGQMPPNTTQLQYSISCEMPHYQVIVLTANDSEYVRYVEEATGTNVSFDEGDGSSGPEEGRAMTLVGQLLSVYAAHAMMMQKLRANEAEERAKSAELPEDPAVLKSRIAELQAQLARVTGAY